VETEVRATLVADASSFTSGMRRAESALESFDDKAQQTSNTLLRFASIVGTATAAIAFFGRRAFQAATEVDELEITMNAVGQATGVGSERIREAARAIEAMGIEMAEARRIAVQFAQNNLDLSQAAKLARVAQDLAVVSQSNSTQTLQRLVRGVMTGNSIILRGAGITTQAGEAYKKYAEELGVSAGALNASQRQQAIINSIMEEGTRVAGAYEASMDNAGKVLRSMPRIQKNLQIAFGNTLLNGMNPLVLGMYKLQQAFSEAVNITPKNADEFGKVEEKAGGLVNAMRALSTVITAILEPITNLVQRGTELAKTFEMSEEQALRFANRLAPMLPLLLSVAAALSAVAAQTLLRFIPGFRAFAGVISPAAIGLFALVATSSEVQNALGQLWSAIQPLIPTFQQLGEMLLTVAMAIGTSVIPIIADLAIILIQALTPLLNWLATSEYGTQILTTLGIAFLIAKTGLGQFVFALAVSGYAALVNFGTRIVAAGTQLVTYSALARGAKTAQDLATLGTMALTGALTALRAAIQRVLAATGIGLLIVGLSLLAEGFIRGWQESQKFRDRVVDAINVVIGAVEKLANAIIRTLNVFLPKSAEIATVSFNRMARSIIKNANDIDSAFQFDKLLDFLDRGTTPEDLSKIAEIEGMFNNMGDAAAGASGPVSRLAEQLKRIERVGYEFTRWALDVADLRDPMAKAFDEINYQVEKFKKTLADSKSTAEELVQGFSDMASVIRTQLTQSLSYARQELQKAKQAYDDFANTIKRSITGLLNFNTALQSGSGMIVAFENLRDNIGSAFSRLLEFRNLADTPQPREFVGFVRALGDALGALGKKIEQSFLGRLRERRDQILEFAEAIRALSDMGISEAALRQITASGYDAGLSMAQELIAGGLEAIAEVNALTDEVMGVIDELSTGVAEDFYTAGGKNGSEFVNGLMEQAERAQEFAEKIRTLIEMGLAPDAIRQVLAAGLEAGSRIADELIAGGSTVIEKVNTMLDAVEQVADEVGEFGAQKFFQGGVDAAQSLVDGIIETIKANESAIDSMLSELAAKLRVLDAAAAALGSARAAVTGAGAGATAQKIVKGRLDDDLMLPSRNALSPIDRIQSDARKHLAEAEKLRTAPIPAAPRTNFAADSFAMSRPPVTGRIDDDLRMTPRVVVNQTNNISQNVDMNRVLNGLNWSIQQALR
jgi:murein DD-endopeptidase MepM/ murein hydrolase activator NlpD